MKTTKLFTLSVLASFFITNTFAQSSEYEKKITNSWKMIKTEIDGKEVEPKHDKLILDIDKRKNAFTITAAYEETHEGFWEIENDKLTLTDLATQEIKSLDITELSDNHLTVKGFDGPNSVLHFIPTSKNAIDLNHKEFLVAKKWTIYKSDKKENIGTRIEFKHDKTFVLLPWGYQVPTMSGKWHLNDDNTKLIIDAREDGAHIEISILELHKHELVLQFDDLGITEYLHDPLLAKKDEKVIAAAHKNEE